MKNNPEFYILGEPIETEIGKCEFIKVKDFPDYFQELQFMSMSKEEIAYQYSKLNKKGEIDELIQRIKSCTSIYEVVTNIDELFELSQAYMKVFLRVFEEESISKITKENFDELRKLILTMNCQKEDKINPNPEIQRALERSRRVKQQESENLTFSDIVTSIVGFNGLTYENIKEMTVYQLYMTFYRIAQIKGYDTSTLFATVATEKINIESWSKHIEMFEEEKHTISHETFKRTTGKVVSE
ncbi:hypothetical protein [uncultured Metabacillus sp.]|uniref:hypothetical protein n=1 Tax=uncultured Metabacillus sp. TaxID=2860135 RepID=UPI0026053697|nr:hypothetical protein [uncultured Metabacillus sp.]